MSGSGLARGLGLELGAHGHFPDRDGAPAESIARLAEDFAPAFDECLRLRHPRLPRAPRRDRAATRAAITRASVGRRGRALHMRQTAQTVKLSAGAVLPPTSGGLIVPGMDVGRRRKERHVTPPKASPTPRVGRAPRGPIEGRRDREHIRTVVVPDHDDLALRLADRIVEVIARETPAKGRCVLGLATGSTPLGIYRELIRRHQAGEVDFSRVVTFNLDEYYPMPADSPHSYRRYMWENLFAHVNIRPEQVHVPDGGVPRETLAEHCVAYERAIAEAGGIDFQMLGIGKSGHIGFNEPGSSPDERPRLVTLDTVTRKDASADFFGEDNVPREAITMGVATILEAREIALIATGEHKADIVARAVEGEVSQDVAATFLQRHANATAYLDLAAAAELTRIKTPWVLGPVEWTPELTERAVVWLAEQTGKAILKLTARDYTEHHLSPLLSKYGAAGPINGTIFNSLRDKIRGRRKLPTRKSVVVAALESVGLPATAARFLNLPFYRTGQVRKDPIGPEDVAIVRALLVETRPDLVFVAGDLSDPHGTHRMCQAAVAGALAQYDAEPPEVWLYRGAWQEWPLTEADVLVPLSQDELRAKILAIFKHQSQKDTAPFPGGHDEREFWQRVEARNLETAARADRLGLPEYFAMEAYRILTPKEAER